MEQLLEREGELAALARAVDLAGEGCGALVLVGGEAGIGKTSLVRALRSGLHDRAAFFIGGCELLSVPVPLGPVRELASAAGVGALPELDGDDRLALARALLSALSGCAPVVAVVEDAHWADPGTLDVVRLLARRVEDVGVVVLVTYRDDELAANPMLSALVGDLATNRSVHRLKLRPLSQAAIGELARPLGADAGRLSRLTGGNPFLVVEALTAGPALPESVRDATLARVGRLSPVARGLVEVAAVIGQRVPAGLLAAVAPGSSEAVEEALGRGVLTDDGDGLAFRHELTRQAIEALISPPRRAELHARVVTELRKHPGPADNARLAHHAEGAGLLAEASSYASLAASDAERLGALNETCLQLERALRLGPGLTPGERVDLLLRFSRAANFGGRMVEALDAAQEAVGIAQRELGAAEHGRALNLLAAALWSMDRVAEARAATQEAIALLTPTTHLAELARAHAAAVRIEAVAFDGDVAIEAGASALELAVHAHFEDVRVDVAISVAVARGYRLQPGVLEQLAAAQADAIAGGFHLQAIRACVNAIAVATDARDHAAVDLIWSQGLAMFEQREAIPPRDFSAAMMARSMLDRGRFEQALEFVALSRRSWHGGAAIASVVEGLVSARRSEPTANALLERAREEISGVPAGSRDGVIRAALAEECWLRGDHAAGAAHARAGSGAEHAEQFARSSGELALWAMRCGEAPSCPPHAIEPVRHELAGDWRSAVDGWRALGAPYDAALAALAGDERVAAEAIATLHRLGASATARVFTRERSRRGARAVRGPHRSTLANAAGLTRREQEVLAELAHGTTNAGIAAVLHLSERTVSHHVSAILSKLGARTRMAAVEAARSAGLLSEDRQPRGKI